MIKTKQIFWRNTELNDLILFSTRDKFCIAIHMRALPTPVPPVMSQCEGKNKSIYTHSVNIETHVNG